MDDKANRRAWIPQEVGDALVRAGHASYDANSGTYYVRGSAAGLVPGLAPVRPQSDEAPAQRGGAGTVAPDLRIGRGPSNLKSQPEPRKTDSPSDRVNWGSWNGRKRRPCPEDPVALKGMPIGMYHCPGCGDMQVAGMPHVPPDEDYEAMCGDWPPGYEA